jgi:protein O-GlcNAc transferase
MTTNSEELTVGNALAMAVERHRAGDPGNAANVYREILRLDPANCDVLFLLAIAEMERGRFEIAETLFKQAIEVRPEKPELHLGLGRAYKEQGRYAEAATCYRKALELRPDWHEALVSLGIALLRDDQLDAATDTLRKAADRDPGSVEAKVNLGNALFQAGQHDDAVTVYRTALSLQPNLAEIHNNLGLSLGIQGHLDQATECFNKVLEIAPTHPEALFNLAQMALGRSDVDAAIGFFFKAIQANPGYVDAHIHAGRILFDNSRFELALEAFKRVIELRPHLTTGYLWKGLVLKEQGNLDRALECFELAAQRGRQLDTAYLMAGATYWIKGDYGNSQRFAESAYASNPANAGVLNLKANVAYLAGDAREALKWYEKASEADGRFTEAQDNRLFALNYLEECDGRAISERHRKWGEDFTARQTGTAALRVDRSRHDRLRLGFVSADFNEHSVSYFIEPVLANLDRSAFETYCYYNNRRVDATTLRLSQQVSVFRGIVGFEDEVAARIIANDEIDILFDLSGHTSGNRLSMFALAPAPVQVTYLGYPTTTGLPSMQFRLSDWMVDPQGAELLSTETVTRLPASYFCYRHPDEAPEVAPAPFRARGAISFGSFNNLVKMTPSTFRLWGKVLEAVPQSSLFLKNRSLSDAAIKREVLQRLAEAGVEETRVTFAGQRPTTSSHLAAYGDVDIALDTVPYNGATTTCEALWMGVPVVTLAGTTHAGRMGASILGAAGLAELVARDESEYVKTCVTLAEDRGRLADLRAGLRARMSASALMDHARFTRDFGSVVRRLWDRHVRS